MVEYLVQCGPAGRANMWTNGQPVGGRIIDGNTIADMPAVYCCQGDYDCCPLSAHCRWQHVTHSRVDGGQWYKETAAQFLPPCPIVRAIDAGKLTWGMVHDMSATMTARTDKLVPYNASFDPASVAVDVCPNVDCHGSGINTLADAQRVGRIYRPAVWDCMGCALSTENGCPFTCVNLARDADGTGIDVTTLPLPLCPVAKMVDTGKTTWQALHSAVWYAAPTIRDGDGI